MGRRRRRAGAESGTDGDVIDHLLEIARHSPAVGLGVGAVLFAGGAFLFWGDPKRMMGMGPLVGMPVLMLALLVTGASVIYYLHGRVTGRGRTSVQPQT